ncbi:MAG: TetR/AcrR family transcriptional regulator [Bacillus sp. (in: Bacteria)]|nr:TetR/AcrR family transcriptional regulator [Bacillus sp. (in: firmicutes)]MCM1426222.1 TetR/AcrR family transcriptional regulator [Eubacterium sp.]
MPPKAKFTREEIVAAALKITREKGIEAVTAREIGKTLNSSARPIFTVFQNMEEVLQALIEEAKAVYKSYIEEGLQEEIAFKGVGMAYIKFAIKQDKLFQLLFMKEREQGRTEDIGHVLPVIDDNFETIIQSVITSYALGREDALRLYQNIWIYTHGIATLCATKVCRFTPEEISERETEVFTGLLKKLKEEKG